MSFIMKKDNKIEKLSTPAVEEVEAVVEEGGDALVAAAMVAAAAALKEEEELWGMRFGVGVDEMMNWGTLCLPCWNVEFVENNYGILFNDVVWDDDNLWNFDTSTHHHHYDHYNHHHHLPTSTVSLPSHLPP